MFISETVLPVSPIGSVSLNSTTALVSTGGHGKLIYIHIRDRLAVTERPMVKSGGYILILNKSRDIYCVSEMQ